MILFADTSDDEVKLALFNAGDDLFRDEITFDGKGRQTELLISKIDHLLLKNQAGKSSLTEIIAISGPGSYTGLRIGLSTLNALAYALDIPITGINKNEDPFKIAAGKSFDESSGFASFVLPKYLYPPKITKKP